MSGAPLAVVGAGAFGTALACVTAAAPGRSVWLLARDAERAAALSAARRNDAYLPHVPFPEGLEVYGPCADLRAVGTVLLAVPAAAQAEMASALAERLGDGADLVICAKGLEPRSGRRLSEAVSRAAPRAVVSVLSGPGFAADLAAGLPTAMTIASARMANAETLAHRISGSSFRLYASDDVAGVELGGALKNVMAIAAGISDGAGFGQSARAALIARGLAEMMRLAGACGGRAESLSGLSGLGDLVLTATSAQSRNYRFGLALGEGGSGDELLASGGPLSEGAKAAALAVRMGRELGVDLPITRAVADVVAGREDAAGAMRALMGRPLRHEAPMSPPDEEP